MNQVQTLFPDDTTGHRGPDQRFLSESEQPFTDPSDLTLRQSVLTGPMGWPSAFNSTANQSPP